MTDKPDAPKLPTLEDLEPETQPEETLERPPGGTKTDAGGRPVMDEGGRPVTLDGGDPE